MAAEAVQVGAGIGLAAAGHQFRGGVQRAADGRVGRQRQRQQVGQVGQTGLAVGGDDDDVGPDAFEHGAGLVQAVQGLGDLLEPGRSAARRWRPGRPRRPRAIGRSGTSSTRYSKPSSTKLSTTRGRPGCSSVLKQVPFPGDARPAGAAGQDLGGGLGGGRRRRSWAGSRHRPVRARRLPRHGFLGAGRASAAGDHGPADDDDRDGAAVPLPWSRPRKRATPPRSLSCSPELVAVLDARSPAAARATGAAAATAAALGPASPGGK